MSIVKIDNPASLKQAADVIRSGGVLIYPTDTLYGFGVDARNDAAVAQLVTIKGRSGPWSIVVGDWEMLKLYAKIPKLHATEINKYLPGPVTLILPACESDISPHILGTQKSIGTRIPDHPFPTALTQKLGFPITSTSVNRTGKPPLNSPEEIAKEFDGEFDLLIAAGILTSSKGSTLIDLTGDMVHILRGKTDV